MVKYRYLSSTVESLVKEKMLFMSGPRQVGKTTMAKAWLAKKGGVYLNWDSDEDRNIILSRQFGVSAVVLDELHKYRRWKNWLKGVYDKDPFANEILVTGSARLEVYEKSSDSLFGRYNLIRCHPFSMGELSRPSRTTPYVVRPPTHWLGRPDKGSQAIWNRLEKRSGFPEPYLRNQNQHYNRWNLRRHQLVLRQDARDLADFKLIAQLEQLVRLLPERVGAPLSVNNLREVLSIAYDTCVLWLEWLDRLYYSFRLPPYTGHIARSIQKEKKLYLWNWADIKDPGIRFENMVASHLLKSIHYWTDLGFGDYGLRYWRDHQKREVDFIVTLDEKPICLIEAKLSDEKLSSSLLFAQEKLNHKYGPIPAIQLINTPGVYLKRNNAAIVSAADFFVNMV